MTKLGGLLLFFVFMCTSIGYARNYYFRHYTNESGLSHNAVYCSLQDKRGFLWFGTKDGLNRFDGHRFKVYQHDTENKKSIKSNYITSLCEDPEGLIWLGTNKGLCLYRPETDEFENLDSLFQYVGEIGELKFDSNNNLWIQTSKGLFRYNKKEKYIKHYPTQSYFVPIGICISASGIPWFTSGDKILYKYNYNTDSFTGHEILTPEEKNIFSGVNDIIDAKQYGMLIGTDKLGLKRFDPNSGTIETLLTKDEYGKPIQIRRILPYSDEEYWIGTETGIYILNMVTREVKNFRKSLSNPYAIGDNAIYSLTKDTEGGVWIGTHFKGISYLPNEFTPFEKFFDQGMSNGIRGNAIREITTDQYGNLWIGTEDAGLNKYDPRTGKFYHFIPDEKPGSISGSNIHGLLVDGDKLWIGFYDKGVDILDIHSGKVISHYEAGYGAHDLNNNFVITIRKMKDGGILLGTISGVFRYNPEIDGFDSLDEFAGRSLVYCLHEDHDQTLWVGSLSDGLYYRKKDGESGSFRSIDTDIRSLCSDAVSDIYEDSRSRLWIATRGNGFCRFHPETKLFTRYTMKNGIPSNFIYKILEDARGNLWLSTSKGLICFNPDDKQIKQYTKSNGITNDQFNYKSGFKDKFGKMYFGSIDGMIAFVPEKIKENTFVPPVYFTGFQIFNEEIELGKDSTGNSSVLFTDKITLPYDQSTFSIDFAALSYTSPEMNEYMYRLDGADKLWTMLKTNRKAYYTHLNPGEYLFRLKASNGNGKWSDTEKTLRIIIKPPFWKTIWAYLLYALSACGILYTILRFYSRQLKLQNELKLEKMEDMKQKEIFNAKIDFFTHIAHEIRTPLTLIKGPLDRIIKSEEHTESTRERLLIMQKNTNRLLNLSNQLLDFRKTETEGMKLNFIQTDISELIRETYLRFTPIADEKELIFTISCPEKCIAMVDKEALTKILSNLFTNALKFARKEITVSLDTDNKTKFRIRVNSNGVIIPAEMKENIFKAFFQHKEPHEVAPKGTGIGLYLARTLAELHGGTLFLDKSQVNVNSFVVELPHKQEAYIALKQPEEVQHAYESDNEYLPGKPLEELPIVLIVEDEEEMIHFIARELSEDYQVIKANNGKEALDILNVRVVNLIISDISMPYMDGIEFCRIIKSDINYTHIPLILLTANQTTQMMIEGLEQGADAYIMKPFSTEHLLAQISNLLKARMKLMDTFARSPLVYSNTIAPTRTDEEFLRKINEIILNKLSDPEMSVEYLAETIGISSSGLYRKMKGICKMNPNEFIRVTRLKKAAELLIEGNLSIKEVSYVTGFSTPSHLSSCFQKQFGMKPSEFIKKTHTRIL